MGSLSQSLLIVVEVLLVITLPFVGVAAFQYLRLNSARVKSETQETERRTIAEIVKMAVAAAEQTGLLENLLSAEKKELALEIAERFLREQGINVNLRQLADLIEAEVRNMSMSGTASSAAVTPVEHQALINNAVETAVLAAEQSGMKGLIQNVGTEKKRYAIELATQFLAANGVRTDSELLGGLIEAELMRLFLAARGQLPGSGGS
jgi:hypothetical protein